MNKVELGLNMSWLKEYENKYILSTVANEGFIYRLIAQQDAWSYNKV
jgi:hypothetical protein